MTILTLFGLGLIKSTLSQGGTSFLWFTLSKEWLKFLLVKMSFRFGNFQVLKIKQPQLSLLRMPVWRNQWTAGVTRYTMRWHTYNSSDGEPMSWVPWVTRKKNFSSTLSQCKRKYIWWDLDMPLINKFRIISIILRRGFKRVRPHWHKSNPRAYPGTAIWC